MTNVEPGVIDRFADTAMAIARGGEDIVAAVQWLDKLGCRVDVMERDEHGQPISWSVLGLTGVRVGITQLDPVSAAVQLGFALAGEVWPDVYGRALEEVKRRWNAEAKVGRAAERPTRPAPTPPRQPAQLSLDVLEVQPK